MGGRVESSFVHHSAFIIQRCLLQGHGVQRLACRSPKPKVRVRFLVPLPCRTSRRGSRSDVESGGVRSVQAALDFHQRVLERRERGVEKGDLPNQERNGWIDDGGNYFLSDYVPVPVRCRPVPGLACEQGDIGPWACRAFPSTPSCRLNP